MSGGAGRVFRVSQPLLYSFFCPQIQFTLLSPSSSLYEPSSSSYMRIIVTFKDVGASYDGLVDLFELSSNKATRQFRKCSIDSI
jgi:hypothetical protein